MSDNTLSDNSFKMCPETAFSYIITRFEVYVNEVISIFRPAFSGRKRFSLPLLLENIFVKYSPLQNFTGIFHINPYAQGYEGVGRMLHVVLI